MPQVTDVETKTVRVRPNQRAAAASSRAQAEPRQHLLPRAAFTHRLPQYGIGPGSVASEMGSVEPEHSRVTPDSPSSPSVGGVEAEFPHDTAPRGSRRDRSRELLIGPVGAVRCWVRHFSTVTPGTDILTYCLNLSGRRDLNSRSQHPQCCALDQAGLRPVARLRSPTLAQRHATDETDAREMLT